MRLEKYKINSENIYVLESNGYFCSGKDFKRLIFTFENNIPKYDFSTRFFIFELYNEYLVFSKEYNTIEELKSDYIEYLI